MWIFNTSISSMLGAISTCVYWAYKNSRCIELSISVTIVHIMKTRLLSECQSFEHRYIKVSLHIFIDWHHDNILSYLCISNKKLYFKRNRRFELHSICRQVRIYSNCITFLRLWLCMLSTCTFIGHKLQKWWSLNTGN